MEKFRPLTGIEIETLTALGNRAKDWSQVEVCDPFDASLVEDCRFGGKVRIGSGAKLSLSYIANYSIGADSEVRSVTALECRHRSRFGNGVEVSTVNECGGRTIRICDRLSAQCAYIAAMYRHREDVVGRLEEMALEYAAGKESDMGHVGCNCSITGARFVREMYIGDNVHIDGASLLENGTMLDGATAGIDVKARDFIAVEDSRIDTGAILHSCFVGERAIVANGFTAENSLFFASSHCENGEAAAIFAGPCTVSHHKSSLLIAGIFSFFNAGSGTNQSNHLFKAGAVHQAVHARGCKFASNGYVMAPAAEGAFTMVLGRHTKHHDTQAMPFSYLIEENGTSKLMPALNLRSYGTVRDIAKWKERDRRTVRRDVINFEEHSPVLAGKAIAAIGILGALRDENPEAAQFFYKNTTIKASMLALGIKLYDKYATASLAALLSQGTDAELSLEAESLGEWVDLSGQYISKRAVKRILDSIADRSLGSFGEIDAQLQQFAADYHRHAYLWALATLAARLGRTPDSADIADCIAQGNAAREELNAAARADLQKEVDVLMRTGYGIDSDNTDERDADFRAVRGL